MVTIGSQWVASWSKGFPGAYTWTVRGITSHGVYITSPDSRMSGHLISVEGLLRDYIAV
jgi:hypothetical protein